MSEALAYYDDLDLRCDRVRECNTSHGASRRNVVAKQIIDCLDFGGCIEYGQGFFLRFSEYGEAECRAEEQED